jgi:RNA polymerase sigma-70 factor (ECF subfamily)
VTRDGGKIDLLTRAQRGDRAALEMLCRQEWTTVYRIVAGRVAGRQEAEDLTQEVFARALGHLDAYRSSSGSFRPYLIAVAQNLVRDHWRSQRRRPVADVDSSVLAAPQVGPEAAAVAAEERAELIVALAGLPHRYQEVLRLRLLEGRPVAEVAALLDRSPDAVRQLQRRALTALRSGLAGARDGRTADD